MLIQLLRFSKIVSCIVLFSSFCTVILANMTPITYSSNLFSPFSQKKAFHALTPIINKFPELNWFFKDESFATAEFATPKFKPFWGTILKQSLHDKNQTYTSIEFERTLSSIMNVFALLDGTKAGYQYLIQDQASDQLQWTQYKALHESMTDILQTVPLEAILGIIVYSDLGKSKVLHKKLHAQIPSHNKIHDHDSLITTVFKLSDSQINLILPSFPTLPADTKRIIKNYFQKEKPNFGHLLHAEISTKQLHRYPPRIKKQSDIQLATIIQLIDVSGARGHVSPRGTTTLLKPTVEEYMALYEEIIKHQSYINGYQAYFNTRAKKMSLNPLNPKDYVVAKLAFMSRLHKQSEIANLKAELNSLEPSKWTKLIEIFGRYGFLNELDRHPTYIPTTIINIVQPPHSNASIVEAALCVSNIICKTKVHLRKMHEPISFNKISKLAAENPQEFLIDCSKKSYVINRHAEVEIKLA